MKSLVAAPPIETVSTPKKTAAARQIRGSSLLLVGKVLSMGINFLVQVLIVRYLAKSDYGAFAYALSVVALGETITTFGLDRALTRFVPMYHEQGDYNKLFGTLFMVISTIVSLGLALVLLFYGLQSFIAQSIITDQQALMLLLILIFLSPVNALDTLLNGMFAVFSQPRSIFFRKYLLGPGLKLVVVLLLIGGHSDVFFLAGGYLTISVFAVAIYAIILFRVLRDQALFTHLNIRTVQIPAREVLTFTIPLLTSDLVYVVMNAVDAVLLEYFQDTASVAALRAVQPAAKMNQMVLTSFALLFTPVAARMFVRNDRQAVNNLYWQNAIWIAVISFPIFALTFSLAQPITVFLYGTRYAQSAIILAMLSFGYYFNAALGQNGLTLKVFGKVRYIVIIDILAAVLNLVLNLLLIPRFGAVGAATGTFTTLIIFNILKQAGLRFGTGINLFDKQYVRAYGVILASALVLLVVQLSTSAPIYVSILLAGLTSLLVLRLNRHLLNVHQTFPELLRLPLARYFFNS